VSIVQVDQFTLETGNNSRLLTAHEAEHLILGASLRDSGLRRSESSFRFIELKSQPFALSFRMDFCVVELTVQLIELKSQPFALSFRMDFCGVELTVQLIELKSQPFALSFRMDFCVVELTVQLFTLIRVLANAVALES